MSKDLSPLKIMIFFLLSTWPLSSLRVLSIHGISFYEIAVVMTFAAVAIQLIRRKESTTTAFDFSLIAFLLGSLVSSLHSVHAAASFSTLRYFCFYFMLFFIFIKFRGVSSDFVARGLAVALLPLSVYAVINYLFFPVRGGDGLVRAYSWFSGPNLFGASLSLVIPSIFLYSQGAKKSQSGIIRRLLLALALVGLILSFSRSSIIALMVVSFIYCLKVREGYRWLSVLPLILGALFVAVLLLPSGALQERFLNILTFKWDLYALMRLDIWRSSFSMWLSSPLWGIGLHNFQFTYPSYALPGAGSYYIYQNHAHNLFLQLLAETGIAGFLPFCVLLYQILKESYENAVDEKGLIHRDVRGGLLLGILAYLFHSLMDYTLWYPPVGFLFFILAGISCSKINSTEA